MNNYVYLRNLKFENRVAESASIEGEGSLNKRTNFETLSWKGKTKTCNTLRSTEIVQIGWKTICNLKLAVRLAPLLDRKISAYSHAVQASAVH